MWQKAIFAIFVAGFMNVAVVRAEAPTLGVNHIGLAVSDLDATVNFFIAILGWEKPDYPAVFVTDGEAFVTLWQVEDPATATAFDRRKNVGLHHMALTVESLPALHQLYARFQQADDVSIEFAPEFMGQGPTTHMMIRDPSGLRLEFIVPASRMPKAVQ